MPNREQRAARFRAFLKQFLTPNTTIAPSGLSHAAGFSRTQLTTFLLPDGSANQRGLPRADTIIALARKLRLMLLAQATTANGYLQLASTVTPIRFLIEAGYLHESDIRAWLNLEHPQGFVCGEPAMGDNTELPVMGRVELQPRYIQNLRTES